MKIKPAGTSPLDTEKMLFQAILDNAPIGIWFIGLDGRLQFVNKTFCSVMGIPEERFLAARHYAEVLPPGVSAGCMRSDKECMAQDGPHRSLERLPFTDGKEHLMEITKVKVLDKNGLPMGLIGLTVDITERKKMEDQILQAKLIWEETFDTINDAITIQDRNFNIIQMNKAAEKLIGASAGAPSDGRKCYTAYHGTDRPLACCPACDTLKTGNIAVMERFEPKLKKHLEVRTLPRYDKDHRIIGLVHIVVDITERKKAEEANRNLQTQLFQAQKMESVGRLAGGVAHDFNNILSAIIGYGEILRRRPSDDPKIREYTDVIIDCGKKAATLTQQLLAFSRKQVLSMGRYDLNGIIDGMVKIIERVIGEDIVITRDTGKPGLYINADKGQIEQILLNIAVNARDAMLKGGKLFIRTENVELAEDYAKEHAGVPPGPYVALYMSDSGTGMTREVQERIFEPFFTTKEVGKGTGLGLATVYGIVKQHNGGIYVSSEPGKGTTFTVYLPAAGRDASVSEERPSTALPGGSETILVVDDEPVIRNVVSEILQPLGYQVHRASSSEEALAICKVFDGPIDLVLTDVIMPGMNGMDMSDAIRAIRPSIRVIFMSGYPHDSISHHGVLDQGVVLLQKPLIETALANKVREVLDKRG